MNKPVTAVVALLFVALILGGATAYFYQQSASEAVSYRSATVRADLYQLQAAKENATIIGLEQNISALQARVTSLRAQLANATAAQAEVASLQSQISSDQSQMASDQAAIYQLNQELSSSLGYAGLNNVERLGAFRVTSTNFCFAPYFGPYSVYNYAGYLKMVVSNVTGSGTYSETVSWSAYGVNYSRTATGNATFLVLPTDNLNVTVQTCGASIGVSVAAYVYT